MTRLALILAAVALPGFAAGPWQRILGSVGIDLDAANSPVIVVEGASKADALVLAPDHIVVIEGFGPAAHSVGIEASTRKLTIRHIVDTHAPQMPIIWEQPIDTQIATVPAEFEIFATEKWTSAPLVAGKRIGQGAILWVATSPGPTGMERYPYLLQALAGLGLQFPARSTTLWAFFDSSYRIRADVDYLAARWRDSGIGALHVAAWHNMEADPARDEYLAKLIAACHRNAILVYAWFELPHVSEAFWTQHPEWREKTGLGQDAQLDWRKLMNLGDPDCRRAASAAMSGVLDRFDWDGVNLAELYFESLEGASNPARFTPMNAEVRGEFQEIGGFDPILLFDSTSPYSAVKNAVALRKFLDFRAVLASRMQSDWLQEVSGMRRRKPYLDVVLTHIDDRFDPAVRDELGADVARTLPLLASRHSTLLVEDPANLWNLGAERYARMAEKYRELTPDLHKIGVDINVVERYQDVYPTKKQTGIELFELLHEAAHSFGHVAIYSEQSIEKQDLPLLAASATAARVESANGSLNTNAPEPTRIAWNGPAEIDGRPWPFVNGKWVLAPAGAHHVSAGGKNPLLTLADFNGEIVSILASNLAVELAYTSTTRAIAVLSSPLSKIEVDGEPFAHTTGQNTVLLPAGQHLVTFTR